MQRILIFLMLISSLISCTNLQQEPDTDLWKTEITDAEKAFAQMAADSGVATAFLHFAAEDAVLQRNNAIIKGKSEIQQYFNEQTLQNISLEWAPDFVEVAASGELGYTFGKFTFSASDTTGAPLEAKGIFHTVWKRQANGEWKFVWD